MVNWSIYFVIIRPFDIPQYLKFRQSLYLFFDAYQFSLPILMTRKFGRSTVHLNVR